MKNLFYLPILVSLLFFISCEVVETCKNCQISYETLNGYNISELNSAAAIMGYSNWNSYMNSLYPSSELCGDALDAAEAVSETTDLNYDGTADYRVFWDCN